MEEKQFFQKHFNGYDNVSELNDLKKYFAPGRVNLIGEHIDYNGGNVLPATIGKGIYTLVKVRNDNIVRLRSREMDKNVKINLNEKIEYDKEDGWGNYPKGIIKFFIEDGYDLSGLDILFWSDLPNSSGLSSSAALEVLTSYLLLDVFGYEIDRKYISLISKKAENEFVGVSCGIMDQFSIAFGKEDHAILLDTHTLSYKYVPINLSGYRLIIMSTNKQRQLADSEYNKRREECEEALSDIKKNKDVENLCSAKLDDLEYVSKEKPLKRARHAITENKRVMKSVEALKEDNLVNFGKYLIDSHESLKNDFEVTGKELDTIVYAALEQEECIGARMTGAGFGGSAIAIVQEDNVKNFIKKVSEKYEEEVGIKGSFYVTGIEDGVKEI